MDKKVKLDQRREHKKVAADEQAKLFEMQKKLEAEREIPKGKGKERQEDHGQMRDEGQKGRVVMQRDVEEEAGSQGGEKMNNTDGGGENVHLTTEKFPTHLRCSAEIAKHWNCISYSSLSSSPLSSLLLLILPSSSPSIIFIQRVFSDDIYT